MLLVNGESIADVVVAERQLEQIEDSDENVIICLVARINLL